MIENSLIANTMVPYGICAIFWYNFHDVRLHSLFLKMHELRRIRRIRR